MTLFGSRNLMRPNVLKTEIYTLPEGTLILARVIRKKVCKNCNFFVLEF